MELGNIVDGKPRSTVGHVEVEFDRHDSGPVGYFSVESLRKALEVYEQNSCSEGVYLRLGTASHSEKGDYDTLLALSERENSDLATVCCPRKPDEEIIEQEAKENVEDAPMISD